MADNNQKHSDRRAGQHEEIRNLFLDVLRDERSLKRNGHTTGQWIGRVITPERALLVGLFLFQFYARVERVETDVSGFRERTRMMEQQHERLNSQLSEIDASVEASDKQLLELRATITAQTALLSAQTQQLRALTARQSTTVTRSEMDSAIEQRVRPPLDRMEKALGTK